MYAYTTRYYRRKFVMFGFTVVGLETHLQIEAYGYDEQYDLVIWRIWEITVIRSLNDDSYVLII